MMAAARLLVLGALCLASSPLRLASSPASAGAGGEAEGRYYLHPDIQIAGMPKGGTSHVYQLLSTHRDVRALRKEWCPAGGPGGDLMARYAEEVSAKVAELVGAPPGPEAGGGGPREREKKVVVASACINPSLSLSYYLWVKERGLEPGSAPPKFLYLLRDPAEVLWATFNFWTTEADREKHLPGRWTTTDNYRTPEYFHDLLQAEGRVLGSDEISRAKMRERYHLDAVDGLIEAAGRENVMIAHTADLEWPRAIQFIRRLANFTGLDPSGFDQRVLRGRTNSGLQYKTRGAGRVSENFNASHTGIYEVSGFRPMLPRSRAFIHTRALGFCREVAEKYGVRFEECLREGEGHAEEAGPGATAHQRPRGQAGHVMNLNHAAHISRPNIVRTVIIPADGSQRNLPRGQDQQL